MRKIFRALAIRNYRMYAMGALVSNTGTWMQRVGQDWLVLQLTANNGTALGITTGLQFLRSCCFRRTPASSRTGSRSADCCR